MYDYSRYLATDSCVTRVGCVNCVCVCVCRAVLYNHMKLMFVGVESIGKTSLLMELRKEGRPDASDKTKVTLTPRATCRVCTRQVSARILINFADFCNSHVRRPADLRKRKIIRRSNTRVVKICKIASAGIRALMWKLSGCI